MKFGELPSLKAAIPAILASQPGSSSTGRMPGGGAALSWRRGLDDSLPGSFMLWVPPGGELPWEEPEETEWVRRVVLGATRLASGRSGEVRFPAKITLGKVRE